MDTVEDDSLQIHPPQQIHTKKEKSHKHKHKKSKDHRKGIIQLTLVRNYVT